MRWNLLLGLGFLISLALLPEAVPPKPTPEEIAKADKRGFNEGFECGRKEMLKIVELRKLGEFYYDSVNQRSAFRWYCDDDPAAGPRQDDHPSVDDEDPLRRVTQLSPDPKSRERSVVRRRAG